MGVAGHGRLCVNVRLTFCLATRLSPQFLNEAILARRLTIEDAEPISLASAGLAGALLALPLLRVLAAPTGALAVVAILAFAAALTIFRRGARERLGDVEPDWWRRLCAGGFDLAARLCPDPFETPEAGDEDALAAWGKLSTRYGRRLCVLCLRFDESVALTDEALTAAIRAGLTEPAFVRAARRREVLVCLPMASDATGARSIVERLGAQFDGRVSAGSAIIPCTAIAAPTSSRAPGHSAERSRQVLSSNGVRSCADSRAAASSIKFNGPSMRQPSGRCGTHAPRAPNGS